VLADPNRGLGASMMEERLDDLGISELVHLQGAEGGAKHH